MFNSPAEEREEEEEEPGRRGAGGNYSLIFHKYRLRCQLVPALPFPPQNGELSIITVKSPRDRAGWQQRCS